MLSDTNDDKLDVKKYIASLDASEVSKIPKEKQVDEKPKKEHPKNDDYNEYEYDDRDPLENKEMDDREW